MRHPEGIKSLTVSVPVGADVTLGRKGQGGRGGVTEKDRFHFVSPFEDGSKSKPYLPRFRAFNEAPAEHRRLIKANLIYGSIPQSFTHRLRLAEFPKHYSEPRARPHHIPVCEGNGETAGRWTQDGDKTKAIRCPDELCEFRTCSPPLCKPFSEFLFRPRWDKGEMPSPVCRMRSPTGWASAANIAGFFKQLREQADEMGVADATFFGFPFTIQLVEKTKPLKRQKFWVIVLTPDEDIVTFLRWQREAIRELQAPLPLLAIPDLKEREDDQVIYEDIKKVEVGNE